LGFGNNSGSFAIFAAIRRASSFVSFAKIGFLFSTENGVSAF